jgi:hypothetical protein
MDDKPFPHAPQDDDVVSALKDLPNRVFQWCWKAPEEIFVFAGVKMQNGRNSYQIAQARYGALPNGTASVRYVDMNEVDPASYLEQDDL